jgi:hypothetical protein
MNERDLSRQYIGGAAVSRKRAAKPKLQEVWRGKSYHQLVTEAPAFITELPATFGELLDICEQEVKRETAWNRELADRVRAGEISIEAAIYAAATYAADRVHAREMRDAEWRAKPTLERCSDLASAQARELQR